MALGQCCSLCRARGHNRHSCIRRLHAEIERIEAELVSKEAEVDRLQSLVAGLKVEETRRIVLKDRKDVEAEDRRQRRESQKKDEAKTAPKPSPSPESESSSETETSEWERVPEKAKKGR